MIISLCCFLFFGCQRVDVVIPADAKDVVTLNRSIRSVRKYGQNIGRIIVISREKLTDEAEWVSEEIFPFAREDMNEKDDRVKYRGLLKLYAPLLVKGLSRHILMLDPEVVLCRPLSFLDRFGVPFYHGSWEQLLFNKKEVERWAKDSDGKELWRVCLEEKRGVEEQYFYRMKDKGDGYRSRSLNVVSFKHLYREASFKEFKVDVAIFPAEMREAVHALVVLPQGKLTPSAKASLEQLRRFNKRHEILVVGEKKELEKEKFWMQKGAFSPLVMKKSFFREEPLHCLYSVIKKYDLHQICFIANEMMVYAKLPDFTCGPSHLVGSVSTLMYIKNGAALAPLIQFLDQGKSLSEYCLHFGKVWLDSHIRGVDDGTFEEKVRKREQIVWRKNQEGYYVPFFDQGEPILAIQVASGALDEFKSEGGLRAFPPYLSAKSFRSLAKWVYLGDEEPFDPTQVKRGDVVYVKGSALKYYMHKLHPHIQDPYVLMMLGGDEPSIDLLKQIQGDRKIRSFYCQGKNIPLGLSSEMYSTGKMSLLQEVRDCSVKRRYLLSIDKTAYPHLGFLKESKWCHSFEAISYQEYLLELKQSRFVFCSLQGGEDSYQIWEALYMGAIPVICSQVPSKLLAGLPVIYVQNLDQITQEFLEEAYEKQDLSQEEFLFLPHWAKKIRGDDLNSCKKH